MTETMNPQMSCYSIQRRRQEWIFLPPHGTSHDLTFITRGTGAFWIDGQLHPVRSGEAVFTPSGKAQAIHTSGMECKSIHFMSRAPLQDSFPTVVSYENCPVIQSCLRELENSGSSSGKEAAFRQLLIRLREQEICSRPNAYVENLKTYLQDHMTETFSLTDAAGHVHLHPVYCESLFREHMQCTLLEYQTALRLLRAVHLLTCTGTSVSRIGEQVGYQDPAYFSRVFRKNLGLSPNQYRQQARASVM